jgi:site-specific DNA recombinase
MIFRWYVHGDESGRRVGGVKIARMLSERGIPTRGDATGFKHFREAGVWSPSTVKRILRQETYAGLWHYNQSQLAKGQRTARPRDEWVTVKVPAIIPRNLWEAAQEQAKDNRAHVKQGATKAQYLVQARLRCAVCGRVFQCETDRSTSNVRPYYRCGGQKAQNSPDWKSQTCHRSLRADAVDAKVTVLVTDFLHDPTRFIAGLQGFENQRAAELEGLRSQLAFAENRLERLEA